MEGPIVRSQSFNRRYLPTIDLHSRRQTGDDPTSIQVNRTGAALPMVATLLCTHERQSFAKKIEQRSAWVDFQSIEPTVYAHMQAECGHVGFTVGGGSADV
jgi:hypothetical protein